MSSYAILNKIYIPDITRGESDVAINNDQVPQEIERRLQESFYLGSITKGIFQELEEVFIETSRTNWDGYDALPVEKETFLITAKFIKLLPLYVKPLNISAEPDGNITLEWYRSPDWLFSLSIDSRGFLHYAAKFGTRKKYGSEPFFDSIPQTILDLILVVGK